MCYTIDYMVKLRKQKKKLLSPIQVAQQVIKIQADSSGMSVKEFKRKQAAIIKSQEEYQKTHWVSHLTDAQLHYIATQQDTEPYTYMGKPLSRSNLHVLDNYKRTNKNYENYKKMVQTQQRLYDSRKKLEKQTEPFRKLQEQMADVARRLQGTYLPEQEALLKVRRSLNPFAVGDIFVPKEIKIKGLLHDFEKKDKVDKSHGLNTLMKKHKMKSALDIAPHFLNVFNNPKKSDYYVENYQNTMALAEACGVSPVKLFETLCIHLKVSRKHYEEQRLLSHAHAIEELVNAWDTQKKKNSKYAITTFYNSKARKDWSEKYGWDWQSTKRFQEQFPKWLKILKAKAEKFDSDVDILLNLENEKTRGK